MTSPIRSVLDEIAQETESKTILETVRRAGYRDGLRRAHDICLDAAKRDLSARTAATQIEAFITNLT